MRRYLEIFKSTLSGKNASVASFVIALLGKWTILIYNFKIGNDKALQLIGARNIVNGNGLKINLVHATDITKQVLVPLYAFPAGYSYLIAPLFAIFKNLDLSSLAIDLVTGFFFLYFLRKLMLLIRFPIWLTNFSVLFWGLNIPIYIITNGPTDFLSLTICIIAIYLTIKSVQTNFRFWQYGIGIGIILLILEQLRYLNLPASLIIPAFLLWNGVQFKNRNQFKTGLISLLFVLAGMFMFSDGFLKVFGLLASDQNLLGNFPYKFKSAKSWYPENLLSFYPFMADAFINVDLISTQASLRTSIPYASWMNLLRMICLPLQLAGIVVVAYSIIKNRFVGKEPQRIFMLLGGAISISTIMILVYLSLKKDAYFPLPLDKYWTYISEGRYFAFISLFTYCAFILWAKSIKKEKFSNFLKALKIIFVVLISLDIAHGLWYVSKIAFLDKFKKQTFEKEARLYIRSMVKAYGDKKQVVVTGVFAAYPAYSVLEGGAGLFEIEEINHSEIKTSKPAIFLAIMEKKDLSYFDHFINQKNTRLAKVINDYYFYVYEPETNTQK